MPAAKTGPLTVGVQSRKNVPKRVGELNQSAFFDIFSVKYLQDKYSDKLCSVPYWLKWDADKKQMHLPVKELSNCFTESKKPFIFQPVEIRSRVGGSHANAIFIDISKMTAERFEPHGSRAAEIFPDFRYSSLDTRLKVFFGKVGIRYLPSTEICPYVGPQGVEDSDATVNSYCAAWSLWYVDFRMAYPGMAAEKLVKQMVEKAVEYSRTGQIREYLRRYLSQVYGYMFSEFPEYRDFFIEYDRYVAMRNPPREFTMFLLKMEKLAQSPFELARDGYKTRQSRSRSRSVPIMPDEFERFYSKVLHVAMRD